MKRIGILGAKPNAFLPDADAIYIANASFINREHEVTKYAVRVVVASSLVVAKGLWENVSNHTVYKRKLNAVREVDVSRIVLFTASGRPQASVDVTKYFLESERKPEIIEISVRQRIELTKTIAQLDYPHIDEEFSHQPFKIRVRHTLENWKCLMNWKLSTGRAGQVSSINRYCSFVGSEF